MMLIIVSIMTSTFVEPRRHKRESKYSVHFSIDTRVKGLPCKSQTQGRRYGVLHMASCIKHACVSVYFIAFLVLC